MLEILEHRFDLPALVQVEHGGTRRRGRRLRTGARQRLAVTAGHGLGAGRDNAQALERAFGSDVQALLLRQAPAPLLQKALHALNGVAVLIEQRADAAQEIDILRPLITTPAAALLRTDLAELAFPRPQPVLRAIP